MITPPIKHTYRLNSFQWEIIKQYFYAEFLIYRDSCKECKYRYPADASQNVSFDALPNDNLSFTGGDPNVFTAFLSKIDRFIKMKAFL